LEERIMSTVKDLFENEELMENIVEDIDEVPEDADVTYEVWALGYTADDDCTDDEVLIGEFTDPDAAVECAKNATLEMINELGYGEADPNTAYFSIEVETTVEDLDDEDGGTMNIGTIYSRDLWLDGEYGNEESVGLGEYDNVVCITDKDFELLEDGTLKVPCNLLKDFNKNDEVIFEFLGESDASVLVYKIMSKVIYADGDYYHCELMI
jgi:hypothetical protein